MAKIEAINFNEFMGGKNREKKSGDMKIMCNILTSSGAIAAVTMPKIVLAAGMEGTFGNVHDAIMRAFDAGVVLVIIFAGAAWGLGHRTKAIEILIGVCCGYILARHSIDIRNFLKGI
jgi:hypothetical protein